MAYFAGSQMNPPEPYGPVPSPRQLRWHRREFYGFLHFTVNTFTDKEWGYGDESPDVFAPTAFDADQIVSTAAEAGMTSLILTSEIFLVCCRCAGNGQDDISGRVSDRRHPICKTKLDRF